jgi:crotonobetainyl-CoA:carnitine CoA-transferase CaiB-like acyl-CoA transferase
MSATLPFAGLRVLELAAVLAGPQVGQFFAELGASVLKVEPPAGDVTRTWRTPGDDPESSVSAYFSASNWGKTSLVLDLTQPAAQAELHRLAAEADVLIASYKPGDAEKFGASYAALAEANPRLIYAHLTGYGPASPRVGYDAVLQAETGFMHLNAASPDDPPQKMPVALIDLLAAHQLKEGILTALYQREKTGRGALLTVSLLDSALASLANQGATWLVTGRDPVPLGSGHPGIVPYGTVYRAADGQRRLGPARGGAHRHQCAVSPAVPRANAPALGHRGPLCYQPGAGAPPPRFGGAAARAHCRAQWHRAAARAGPAGGASRGRALGGGGPGARVGPGDAAARAGRGVSVPGAAYSSFS